MVRIINPHLTKLIALTIAATLSAAIVSPIAFAGQSEQTTFSETQSQTKIVAIDNTNPVENMQAKVKGYFENGRRDFLNKDYVSALKWFQKAAESGYAPALTMLGNIYANGLGVEVNDSIALSCFIKAATQGDADAEASLGVYYTEGRGVERDYKEAADWLMHLQNVILD